MSYYRTPAGRPLTWQVTQHVSTGPDSKGYYHSRRVQHEIEAPTAFEAAQKFGHKYLDGAQLLGPLRVEQPYTDRETEQFYVVFSGQMEGHGLRIWIQTEG